MQCMAAGYCYGESNIHIVFSQFSGQFTGETTARTKPESFREIINKETKEKLEPTTQKLESLITLRSACSFGEINKINDTAVEYYTRQIKSDDNLTMKKYPDLRKDEIECLQGIFETSKKKNWNEKLVRLAKKIHRPGVEDKLKRKIERYIKSVPSQFSDNDEDGKEFRRKLPEYFVEHLKRMSKSLYGASERSSQEVESRRKESNVKSAIGHVVKNWLKTVPLKETDYVNSSVTRNLLKSIVNRLEPFISNLPKSRVDCKSILSCYVSEIIDDVPIDMSAKTKTEYRNTLKENLVNKLLQIDECHQHKYKFENDDLYYNTNYDISCSSCEFTVQDVKDFVKNELAVYFHTTGKQLDEHKYETTEMDITGILLKSMIFPSNTNNDIKLEIKLALQETGKLSEYQAKYCSEKITEHLKTTFKDRYHRASKNIYTNNEYFVYQQNNYPYRNISNKHCSKESLQLYKAMVSKYIDKWLDNFELHVPLIHQSSFRNMAVNDLAEDLVKRKKNMLINQSTEDGNDEFEKLQIHIHEWIRKLAGEDTTETIEHVPELIKRIQSLSLPMITKFSSKNKYFTDLDPFTIRRPSTSPSNCNDKLYTQLYKEIYEWSINFPDKFYHKEDRNHKDILAHKLAESIKKIIKSGQINNDAIESEIRNWIKTTLKIKPHSQHIEEIVAKIKAMAELVLQNSMSKELKDVSTSISYIRDSTEVKTIDDYLTEVQRQIDTWLTSIGPNIKNNIMRRIAVIDLAEDIVERYKYLKLMGRCCSPFEELEHLKYQIYKWMYKLSKEENFKIVENASSLLQKLKSIRDPMVQAEKTDDGIKTHQRLEDTSFDITNFCSPVDITRKYMKQNAKCICSTQFVEQDTSDPVILENKELVSNHDKQQTENYNLDKLFADISEFLNTVNVNINKSDQCNDLSHCTNKYNVKTPVNHPRFLTGPMASKMANVFEIYAGSVKSDPEQTSSAARNSNHKNSSNDQEIPQGMTLDQTYEYFDKIFIEKVKELPLSDSTEEKKNKAERARKALLNGIWKAYLSFKADPIVENDYNLFEQMIDQRLDEILDCLKQSSHLKTMRAKWKLDVRTKVMEMLKYEHNITDSPSFKEQLGGKITRQLIKSQNKKKSDEIQEIFTARVVNNYILDTAFQSDDPVKANIYRQRLSKRLEELLEHLKRVRNVKFRDEEIPKLLTEAYGVLKEVPIPDERILKEEAEEILFLDEIEEWYVQLPVTPITNLLDDLFRNRMREVLARKLQAIEKQGGIEEELDQKFKHEISMFLEQNACLEQDEDLNINFMADELVYRLKNLKYKDPGYGGFQRENFATSSIVQPYPVTDIDPLLNPEIKNQISVPREIYHGIQLPVQSNTFPHGKKSIPVQSGVAQPDTFPHGNIPQSAMAFPGRNISIPVQSGVTQPVTFPPRNMSMPVQYGETQSNTLPPRNMSMPVQFGAAQPNTFPPRNMSMPVQFGIIQPNTFSHGNMSQFQINSNAESYKNNAMPQDNFIIDSQNALRQEYQIQGQDNEGNAREFYSPYQQESALLEVDDKCRSSTDRLFNKDLVCLCDDDDETVRSIGRHYPYF